MMLLNSFKYKTKGWELSEIKPIHWSNLFVGRNATGKTRAIKALSNVTSFMQSIAQSAFWLDNSFDTAFSFIDPDVPDWKMEYGFQVKDGKVEKEMLIVNEVHLIRRNKNISKYKRDTIDPPKDKLIVQVRRDRTMYPEIEALMSWVEGVSFVSCSIINPYTILNEHPGFINPVPFSELVESLKESEKKKVLATARELGYDVVSMESVEYLTNVKLVSVRERYFRSEFLNVQLSSGMLRVLYLLCFLEYIKHSDKISLLLIDDLGEGLDYSRATQLGQLIFQRCLQDGLQLIASSNDAFLMEVVDISNWQILNRKGSKVSSINQNTYPDLFRDFKMTGLSNFDFFSSDFIDKYFHPVQ